MRLILDPVERVVAANPVRMTGRQVCTDPLILTAN